MQQFGTNFLPHSKEVWCVAVCINRPALSENLEIGFQKVLEDFVPALELPDVCVTSVNAEWQGVSFNTIKHKELSEKSNFRIPQKP